MALECTLTTPEELVFEGAVDSVIVPAADGEMGFLPRHAPIVGSLGFGELRVSSQDGGKQAFFVNGGFVQVVDDRVTVLAVEAQAVGELDAESVRADLSRLESSPPESGASVEELQEYSRSLSVARARLKISERG
jgi:F-type H+-transporting ATPase subunit epsilon